MAMMKEAAMARDEIIDQVQKLVLCGRATLDALEALTKLCLTAEEPHAACTRDGDESERVQPANDTEQIPHDKTARLEEVRGLLAEKSRKGFRAEVKALLTAHGVNRLSEISDPAELGKLMAEAERIGASA